MPLLDGPESTLKGDSDILKKDSSLELIEAESVSNPAIR